MKGADARPSAPLYLAAAALLLGWAELSYAAVRADLDRPEGWVLTLAFLAATAAGLSLRPLRLVLRFALLRPPTWAFLAGVIAVASALSLTLWFGPMNAQVISGDACIYTLQARAASHLDLAVPVSPPRLAHAAKFLVEGRDARLHSVFVPGYPMFIAPWVRLGVPWLAGPVTGALLALAQYFLARVLTKREAVARLSLLLMLPSFARAVETSDLLSHAFVGALDCFAIGLALSLREAVTLRRAALLGVAVGWTFCARMLDGFVLTAVVAAVLAGPLLKKRLPWRAVVVGLACGLPFIGVVALQQWEATGSFRKAVVLEYAERADWPAGCLRLGFGRDVGCYIEHRNERASFGHDGYTLDDAHRVVRERTGRMGDEVFALAAFTVAAYAAVVIAPEFAVVVVALFPLLLTLAYGLFYYGNGLIHGARHVFPAAPVVAVLLARAMALASRGGRWRGTDGEARAVALALGWFAAAGALMPAYWREGYKVTHRFQDRRQPVRRIMARQGVTRGIVVIPDVHSYLEALDPWTDGDERVLVHDDKAGVVDLRRFHPELPVWLMVPSGRLVRSGSPPPGPGVRVELERAWPSFQRQEGLAAAIVHTLECCMLPSSGQRAMALFEVRPGGRFWTPFDVERDGRYRFRVTGFVTPDSGDWRLRVDQRRLPDWEGYAEHRARVVGEWSAPVELSAGRHYFEARSRGKDARSAGMGGTFDVLEGELLE